MQDSKLYMQGSRLSVALSSLLMVFLISAYAGLIPLGQWQPDEYLHLAMFRDNGINNLFFRISSWSPRPLSEFLIYCYAAATEWARNPLVTPMLGGLWLIFLGAAFLPLLSLSEATRPDRLDMLLVLSFPALFLSGHPVSEVFYWTMGAVAYLPTFGAILYVTVAAILGQRDDGRSWLLTSAMLVAAALSSEVGAFFVLAYGGAMLALLTFAHVTWHRISRRDFVASLVPLATAIWVLWMLSRGRFGTPLEIYGDPNVAHHLIASLKATLFNLPGELLTLEGAPPTNRSRLLALFSLGAFALGCLLMFSSRPKKPNIVQSVMLASLAIAAAVALFMSLFGAYYQFGQACCERHETSRICLAIVFIAVTARLATLHLPLPSAGTDANGGLAALAIAASVVSANVYSYPSILLEYARYGTTRTALERTWASGQASGDAMTFYVPPKGVVNSAMTWPRGHFANTEPAGPVRYVLDYFGKKDGVLVGIDE